MKNNVWQLLKDTEDRPNQASPTQLTHLTPTYTKPEPTKEEAELKEMKYHRREITKITLTKAKWR